jgi:tetratricopeptide (TPR) repeat protein
VEQVRPLLPGAAPCVTVVTSRDSLAGLVARDGARRLDLDLLPPGDAVGLLRALIGSRAAADPGAAAALADQCSRLPLALRVAAELAVARPTVPLADLVRELADQQRRLEFLDASGDPRTAVRTVFSWSYRHLDSGAARAFRQLGLNPGPDLDCYAAAALIGTTRERAERQLDLLVRACLIQSAGPGRYGMHDLLRAYARELAATQDRPDDRRAALTRLFDHYLHSAVAAMDTLFPAERGDRPRIPATATRGPSLTVPAEALGWLDAERASLVAAVAHAAGRGWPEHATRLAVILFRYLDSGGYWSEAISVHTCARRAAQQTGDHASEAAALTSLGVTCWQQGRYQQASGHLRQALDLFREIGDRRGAARALNALGLADMPQGRYEQAAGHLRQALDLFGEIGHRAGAAYALGNLGVVDQRQGRYEQAAGHHRQALDLFGEIGHRAGAAYALGNLGVVERLQGFCRQATDHLQQAVAVCREMGDRAGEAHALNRLGDVRLRQGMCQQAKDHHQQALNFFREVGDRSGQVEALNGLGEAFLATGQPGHARTLHTAALGLASEIGERHEQARAHDGLAHSYDVTGDARQARRHWQEALNLFASLGVPEADQVRAQLATST